MNHHDQLPTIAATTLATVIGGRSVNPAGGAAMNVMTVLDNPGRAFNRAMESVGAGNNTRAGQTYTPAQMNSNGSVTDGRFTSGPSPVPKSM